LLTGQADKVVAFSDLLKTLNLSADEVAYVGDDVIDLPVMTKVGFSIAVCAFGRLMSFAKPP
jgi:3-deoxy-D-manno-octulosonate 8-phosphate phosphatase (KDO 8-P phosphatase)